VQKLEAGASVFFFKNRALIVLLMKIIRLGSYDVKLEIHELFSPNEGSLDFAEDLSACPKGRTFLQLGHLQIFPACGFPWIFL